MGIASALGGIFDPGGQAAANTASQAITDALKSGSPYWQAGQLSDDGPLLQGAAQLRNTNIGLNTGALDADTAAYGDLGALYSGIAQNGGALTKAVGAQAAADLANTSTAKLRGASREQAGTVLAQDQAERNWAAAGANQSRAQQLATQLQKQVWNTAVSHANFEAALAGKGLQNQDTNLAGQLALTMNQAAMGARNNQETLGRQQEATDFNNAMAALRGITAAAGGVSGTIASMNSASGLGGNAATSKSTGFLANAQNYDAGYALPQAALGTSFNVGSSKLKAPAAFGATGNVDLAPGQVDAGTTDLSKRNIVYNDDGTWSTVRSMTFKDGNKYVVVPSAYDGALHSPEEAFNNYKQTGAHMGKFTTQEAADRYAESIHDDQATQYKPQQSGWDGVMGPMQSQPTQSNYVNPVTGNTVDMNMPTEASAWGDWITSGSSLASV